MDPRKKSYYTAIAVVAALPLVAYVLGWSVYRDPADDSLHLAHQVSALLPCANGDMRVVTTTLGFGPSDKARRDRLQAIRDGHATLDCGQSGTDPAKLGP